MMGSMSYVEKNLMPGEQLLLSPRYHWIRFAPGVAFVVLGIVALAVWFLRRGEPYEAQLIWGVAGLFVLGLFAAGWRWLVDSFDEFAITSTRVIRKSGFLSRNLRQIPLDRVQDLNIKATLGGRWLSYGDVELQTAGSDGTVVFPRIRHPEEFRNVLFVHRAPAAGGGLGASAPARPTAEQRLRELEGLKAQGLVGEEEYRERRKAILDSV
jgi:membrane protein YdbS with pleckstrin-like domain